MKPVKNDGEIRVTLLRFGQPDANGRVYSFKELQSLIDGNFLKRVSDKTLFGEIAPPKPELGVVRVTEVAEEEVCLRVSSVNLQRHALLGRVVPAGPRKAEFEALIAQYVKPIPLAMRAFQHADGSLSITSFDLCSSMLQNHPKLTDGVTLSSRNGFLPVKTSDFLENTGTLEQNTLLNPQPIKKPYVKPEVKTVTKEEYDAAVKPAKSVRKKAAKKTARGQISENSELNARNIADYDVYFNALKNDEEVRLVVGGHVKILEDVTAGEFISFVSPALTLHSLAKWTDSSERVTYVTSPTPATGGSITHTTPEEVRKGLDLLQSVFEQTASDFTNRNKETTPVTTPIPTLPVEKKPSAKAVFKNIEPIVSKNVEAHYDQVFRVNPKGKLDGTFKKLGDKKGAFVRLAGSTDVYMLPYTIKSEKPAAAERSLNSALATRKVEVLSVDDLNPAPAPTVQFKFVDPKTSK